MSDGEYREEPLPADMDFMVVTSIDISHFLSMSMEGASAALMLRVQGVDRHTEEVDEVTLVIEPSMAREMLVGIYRWEKFANGKGV